MNYKFLSILFAVLLSIALFSCSEGDVTDAAALVDEDLVNAIVMADNLESVAAEDLPGEALNILNSDYQHCVILDISFAPEYGYQVSMFGDKSSVFFNTDGRKLKSNTDRKPCFEYVFPITFSMPDGSEITLESPEDYLLIREWYKNHDSKVRPVMQFPYTVILADGQEVIVENVDMMKRIKINCFGNKKGNDKDVTKSPCFTYLLPVTYEMPDGSLITIETKEDWSKLRQWYEGKDTKEKPIIQYPFVVVMSSGTEIIVENEEMMQQILVRCREMLRNTDDKGKKGDDKVTDKQPCFEIVFPRVYLMPDGSEIKIESADGMSKLREWYKGKDYKKAPVLQYPYMIVMIDGTEIVVENEDMLLKIKEKCKELMKKKDDDNGNQDKKPCFTIEYPRTYMMPDGSEIIIESAEEMAKLREWYQGKDYKRAPVLQYPYMVVMADGTEIIVENEEMMIKIKKKCRELMGGGNGDDRKKGGGTDVGNK